MNWNQRLLLSAYRLATRPYRITRRAVAGRLGRVPISLLYYHRVADDPNPWTISFRRFQRHIDWLQSKFDLVSLSEAQQRIRSGFNARPSVAITFDDGYAENCLQAIPLLLERQVPFTYFVVWENVRDQRPFPHDLARGQPLVPNSLASIRALADMGVEIGSHSLTHPDIASIKDLDELRREIVGSKAQLEAAIGRPVRYFAFPYGQRSNLAARAFEMGRSAGYWGMCSAYGGYNEIGDDPFHLLRFHGDPEIERLKNWLDFDPRAQRIRRVEGGVRTGITVRATGRGARQTISPHD